MNSKKYQQTVLILFLLLRAIKQNSQHGDKYWKITLKHESIILQTFKAKKTSSWNEFYNN
jgi:hypothetical protein